jgi:hypothetical protein
VKLALKPYSFSWRFGIENDPGRQGYHGLKELVSDEFIKVGGLCYLWTSVYARSATTATIVLEGDQPAAIWLNGRRLTDFGRPVELENGANPLLLRYDGKGRGAVVFMDKAVKHDFPRADLAMKWYCNPAVLSYDLSAGGRVEHGFRFDAPPGLVSMSFRAYGRVRAWAAGQEMNISKGRILGDGSCTYTATVADPNDRMIPVAISATVLPGFYGAGAFPEYIRLECKPGRIAPGDWSKMGALAAYSGGAWYRRTVRLSEDYLRGRTIMDLGRVRSSAEVYVNGRKAGVLLGPDWRLDVTEYLVEGDNRLEILVYNTLGNHYETIPTQYRGSPEAGLIGPVRLVNESEVVLTE